MKNLLSTIKISVPEKIFLKDPESSDLGKRIIEHSILLIDEIGFDITAGRRRFGVSRRKVLNRYLDRNRRGMPNKFTHVFVKDLSYRFE